MSEATPFTESNALLAIVRGDCDYAREIIVTRMLPAERRKLMRQAQELADMCGQIDLEYKAAHGPCTAIRNCGQPSIGYFHSRRWTLLQPTGVCAEHRASVEGEGFTVLEMPEV